MLKGLGLRSLPVRGADNQWGLLRPSNVFRLMYPTLLQLREIEQQSHVVLSHAHRYSGHPNRKPALVLTCVRLNASLSSFAVVEVSEVTQARASLRNCE
jgi:hypothetical protein